MREPEAIGEDRLDAWRTRLADWEPGHVKAFFYRLLMRHGPPRLSRDLGIVYDQLIAAGRAVWLGQPFPAQTPPPLEDVPRAVARIRALGNGVTTESEGAPPGAARSGTGPAR